MATTETQGRMLPPPAKPKRKGHEPPPEPAGSSVAAGALQDHQERPAPAPPPPIAERAPEAAEAVSTAPEGTGSRTTVYSDVRIDDFLQEVKIEAAMARLDLTASAVWRRAMYDLMETTTPGALVQEFEQAAPEDTKPGRPRR